MAYFTTKRGRRKLKSSAQQWCDSVHTYALQECVKQNWIMEGKGVWYYVDMIFYFPDWICRDNHNMHKVLWDALEGAVYTNDYYIMPRTKDVLFDPDNPRLELTFKIREDE